MLADDLRLYFSGSVFQVCSLDQRKGSCSARRPHVFLSRCFVWFVVAAAADSFWGIISTDASSVDCSKPPLDVHPKDCCFIPPLLDESLLHGCKQLHGGEHLTRGLIHERGSCFIECAMNATGTLLNGVLDQPAIMQLIASRSGGSNTALMQVMVASCVKCFQLATQNVSIHHPIDSKHCRPMASRFISCVNMETFKMCLPEFWNNSDSCNNLQLHIINCPIPM